MVAKLVLIFTLLGLAGCTLVANPDPYYPYPVQRYVWIAPSYGYYGGYYPWRRPCPPSGGSHHQSYHGYRARAGRRSR